MKQQLSSLFVFIAIVFCGYPALSAQTIPFQWLQQVDAKDGSVLPQHIKTDRQGNCYATGHFVNTFFAGGDSLVSVNPPYSDIFLIKYDSLGNYLWAKSFGETDIEHAYGLTTDADDNVYICGMFYSDSLSFDSITITKGNNFSAGFWAKFDSNGQCLLAKVTNCFTFAVGLRVNAIRAIEVDSDGNIFVTGGFMSDSLCFDATCLGLQNAIPQTFGGNVFIAKFNPAGNCLWLRGEEPGTIPGRDETGLGLAIDQANNIYMTGIFSGNNMIFGTRTLGVFDLQEGFCAKLDNATGTVSWVRGIRAFKNFGFSYDDCVSIVPDNNGSVYIGGNYDGLRVNFDSLYTISLPVNAQNPEAVKVFLFKLDAATGLPLWGKGFGDTPAGFTAISNLSLHPNSTRLALAGSYEGRGRFDAFQLPITTVPGQAGYLLEVDTSGNVLRGVDVSGNNGRNAMIGATYTLTGQLVTLGNYSTTTAQIGTQYTIQNALQPGAFSNMFICHTGAPLSSSTPELSETDEVTVFPNPSQGQLTVLLPASTDPLLIRIYDVAGQVVLNETISGGIQQLTLATAHLSAGYYVLTIVGEELNKHAAFIQSAK